ncbi:hypothetical protein Sjap_024510 [Stephania japonica]|uniref:Uncharacterized protein n=1 Tax=Stephania japonica TaxID=461633 RepID=A0AAP0HJX6_9MAGN
MLHSFRFLSFLFSVPISPSFPSLFFLFLYVLVKKFLLSSSTLKRKKKHRQNLSLSLSLSLSPLKIPKSHYIDRSRLECSSL